MSLAEDNKKILNEIIDSAKDISGLTALSGDLNLQDEIILRKKSTGQTLKTTIEKLKGEDGIGLTTVRHKVPLQFSIDDVSKGDIHSIFGGLRQVVTADTLGVGDDIVGTNGRTKLMIVVNAGTDLIGDLKITGTKVDRDTGLLIPNFEETLTIDSLSVDTTSPDALGNDKYNFTNCYITSEWYTDGFVISTLDLDLTDVDIYSCAFNQFNGIDSLTINSVDMTAEISSGLASFSGHAYAVEVVDNKVSVTSFADNETPSSEIDPGFYRFRVGNLTKSINTDTDGIFIDTNFMPFNVSYWSSVSLIVWAVGEQDVSVVVDGSLGLDSIIYGESLQVGDLVYLKTDGKYWKADNTSELTSTTELRLILTAGILDDEVIALAKGQYVGSGFTAGNEYVGTSGTITSSRPTLESEVVRIVSTSINATTRYFDPSKTWLNGTASKINGVTIAGAGTDFLDNIFTILNATDQTKKLQLDASLITSGETVTAKTQGRDGTYAYLDDIANLILDNNNALVTTSDAWSVGGMNVRAYATNYPILAGIYNASAFTVTHDLIDPVYAAANPTHARKDAVVADVNGQILIIKGTVGLVVTEPYVDTEFYFLIRYILITSDADTIGVSDADSETPTTDTNIVYKENLGEGGGESNAVGIGSLVDVNNQDAPLFDSVNIKISSPNYMDRVNFNYTTLQSTSGSTNFDFNLQLSKSIPFSTNFFFGFYKDGVRLKNASNNSWYLFIAGKHGFEYNTTDIQYISIPLNEAGYENIEFDMVECWLYVSDLSLTYKMDNFVFKNGFDANTNNPVDSVFPEYRYGENVDDKVPLLRNGVEVSELDLTKYTISQITITTTVSITTDTLSGIYSQSGKNTILDNGVNAINLTVNGGVDFVSSYLKHGTGAITFVQGVGRTLVQVNGTAVLDGAVGSTATISSVGTTDYLKISNA